MTTRLDPTLASATSPRWAPQALRDPLALLSDHAHLERKAAGNALELMNRWPETKVPAAWTHPLARIARDETSHLHSVLRLLEKRGGKPDRIHHNDYAKSLHSLVRRGQARKELLDRLLVSALIEARSCERFGMLVEACGDAELRGFYGGLMKSEKGHHAAFLRLALLLEDEDTVAGRWESLKGKEAEILASQSPGPRMHGGC